jgi:hypothetical protein
VQFSPSRVRFGNPAEFNSIPFNFRSTRPSAGPHSPSPDRCGPPPATLSQAKHSFVCLKDMLCAYVPVVSGHMGLWGRVCGLRTSPLQSRRHGTDFSSPDHPSSRWDTATDANHCTLPRSLKSERVSLVVQGGCGTGGPVRGWRPVKRVERD